MTDYLNDFLVRLFVTSGHLKLKIMAEDISFIMLEIDDVHTIKLCIPPTISANKLCSFYKSFHPKSTGHDVIGLLEAEEQLMISPMADGSIPLAALIAGKTYKLLIS